MHNKPYCHICGKTFKSERRLKRHLNHHKKISFVNYLSHGIMRDYE